MKDNTEQRNLVKEDWLQVKRLLARMVNAKGKAMPDWRAVRKQPIYSIRASLGRWKKVKRKRIAAGGQTAITGFFRAAPRAASRAQHAHGGGSDTVHSDDNVVKPLFCFYWQSCFVFSKEHKSLLFDSFHKNYKI